jgi:hypothetical protein
VVRLWLSIPAGEAKTRLSSEAMSMHKGQEGIGLRHHRLKGVAPLDPISSFSYSCCKGHTFYTSYVVSSALVDSQ